jgi:hypothetical protein
MSRAADRADRLPLTGADAFLLAFDAETRRRNRANHLSQIVLRLGPGFSPESFERVLREVVDANPILRAPIRRRAVVGLAEYRLDLARRAAGPAFEMHESRRPPPGDWDAPVVLPELFAERLNELHPDGRAGSCARTRCVMPTAAPISRSPGCTCSSTAGAASAS